MTVQDLETPVPTSGRIESVGGSHGPVLVAVDFSPASEAALIWAANFARCIGAPLEVLHVVHDPADAPGTYKAKNGDPLVPMTEVARDELEALVERANPEEAAGVDDPARNDGIKLLCEAGLPAPTILRVAEARGAQHLVLGSHGRNGLSRFLHGSVPNQIATQAKLPLTIVKSAPGNGTGV